MAAESSARLEIYLPLLDGADPILGGTPKAGVLEKFERVRAVIRDRVAPSELLDLTVPLQAAASKGEQLYWIHDPHWNRRGNAAVAEIVARYLAEAGAPPAVAR
jgi:hypothetical protein